MGIKPWEWDYRNYGDADDACMIGFFYQDDLANLEQLEFLKREWQKRHPQGELDF